MKPDHVVIVRKLRQAVYNRNNMNSYDLNDAADLIEAAYGKGDTPKWPAAPRDKGQPFDRPGKATS